MKKSVRRILMYVLAVAMMAQVLLFAPSAVSAYNDPDPTWDSAATLGTLSIGNYTSGLVNGSNYKDPHIWYPTNGTAPYPGVIWIPGYQYNYTDYMTDLVDWANFLASHGFIVMYIDPTNLSAYPSERETALQQAMATLIAENTRPGSPINGKLNVNSIGVMGHSFGGAGALLTANDAAVGSPIKAAIGLSPVGGLYSNDKVPSLIFGGQGDNRDFAGQYTSIPSTTKKALVEFKTISGFDMHDICLYPLHTPSGEPTLTSNPTLARIGLSWLKINLSGDTRYQQFIIQDSTMNTFSYNNGSGGGSLTGAVDSGTSAVDLTTTGTTDWAHWYGYDHKSSGGSKISNYSIVGSGSAMNYTDDLRQLSWTDGTPTGSGSDYNGIFIAGVGNGFSITAPADTNTRTIKIYVGGWNSGGTLTATLSDGSAASYSNTSLSSSGQYDGTYTLTYKAGSANKTITVRWTQASGSGNVTLQGAAMQ